METHALSYLLWAIQLAREAQGSNLAPSDSSAQHCATKPFISLPINFYTLDWTLVPLEAARWPT